MSKKSINWHKYSKRMCQSMHHCRICGKTIALGAIYYDGGYSRRAHESCVGVKSPTPEMSRKDEIIAVMKKHENEIWVENAGALSVTGLDKDFEKVATEIEKLFEVEGK